MRRTLLFTLLLSLMGGLGFVILVYANMRPTGGKIWHGVPAQYEVSDLAEALGEQGLVENPKWFEFYVRLMGGASRLRTHTVVVPPRSSPFSVLRIVAKGYGEKQRRVLLREGLNRFEMAEILEALRVCPARAFLAASAEPELLAELGINGPSAEGYLFPDTYAFATPTDAAQVVRRLVENFRAKTNPVLASADDPFRVLTLASIVEEEAQKPSERWTVAGVFQNRLDDPGFVPKRLQADPTVSYGCWVYPRISSCIGFNGARISKAMLRDAANPYNTYRHEGLPPGPISNPGLAAIKAALKPQKHAYLYFVARGDGSHAFAQTLAKHNANVTKYILE